LSGPAFCGKAARDWARRCSAFSRFQAWRKWRTDFSSAGATAAGVGWARPADGATAAPGVVAEAAAATGDAGGASCASKAPSPRPEPVRTAAATPGAEPRAARRRPAQPLGQQGLGPRGLGRQAPGQGLQVGKAHRVGLVQARRPQRRQLGLGRPGLSHGWRRPRAPWGADAAAALPRAGRAIGAISTRRLRARPSASALEATGCCAPKAAAKTLAAGTPSSISARVTVSARWADSSQLSARVAPRLLAAGAHGAVVGEAADHQHLVAGLQVGAQRRGQALEQLAPLGLQIGRVEGEQHAAGDADAAVVQRHPPGGQRAGQGLLQGLAALGFELALLHLAVQPAAQLVLGAQHAQQDEHQRAHQAGHQVGEHRPDRRGGLQVGLGHVAVLGLAHHAAAPSTRSAAWVERSAMRCRSSRICFCDRMLRSMTSRAWAT
jgi:hypothetical protein